LQELAYLNFTIGLMHGVFMLSYCLERSLLKTGVFSYL
jgi:hypothetical protein